MNLLLSKFLPTTPSTITAYTHDRDTHAALLHATRTTVSVLNLFFASMNYIVGQPIISVSASTITVHVPYYPNSLTSVLSTHSLNSVATLLSTIFGRSVNLYPIKVEQPYLDAQILAQFVSQQLGNGKFTAVIRRVFATVYPVSSNSRNTMALPAYINGIKIRLAGRLITERTRPRETVQIATIGSLTNRTGTILHIGSHTAINQKGSYTVQVWLSSTIAR